MTNKKVAVLDLGLGNLHSVVQALLRAGASAGLVESADQVKSAERLVFPGQGAFAECAQALGRGLGDAVVQYVASGRPYLGICLGMQALFEGSEEAHNEAGIGLFKGRVTRFAPDLHDQEGRRLKVPHMGWNQVKSVSGLAEDGAWYYFTHSYKCEPEDDTLIAATAQYGGPFCAAIHRDNVYACQFHPEKSHRAGAQLLERFVKDDRWS